MELLVRKGDFDAPAAEEFISYLVSGEASDAQIGGALSALAAKGATATELAAFARVLRAKALQVGFMVPNLVDTCGTGGGAASFNISTAAAFVAAAAGAHVAKHGNRAVTSVCGSADVLEELGARIDGDSEQALHLIETVGIAFLFAQAYHPAMKAVGKVRRELGFRTVFNQLGPLLNPAGAKRQLIGVYDPSLLLPMGLALREIGAERALVVHGSDGLDEISPCNETWAVRVWDGEVAEVSLNPKDFGLDPISRAALEPGDSVANNAAILREAISDVNSPRARAILPSVGAVLWLAGIAHSPAEGCQRGLKAIETGAANLKLNAFVEASQAA